MKKPKPELDYEQITQEQDNLAADLGWTKAELDEYILTVYSKRIRSYLTDEELQGLFSRLKLMATYGDDFCSL